MAARQSQLMAKAHAVRVREFRKLYHPRPAAKKPKPYKPTSLEARRLEVSRRRYMLRALGSDAVFLREELRPLDGP